MSGQYPTKEFNAMNASGSLVKQFNSFYIVYASPQSACSDSQAEVPKELAEFKEALPTIKELN